MGNKKLSDEQEKHMVEEYIEGAAVNRLITKYGFKTKKSLIDKVKKYYPDNFDEKIEIAKQNRKGYKYTLEKITSEFDAYFLGLIMTDGYISRETDVGIDLVDEDCIKFLSETIGKPYKSYSQQNGHETTHRLILSDREFVNNLKRFGVIPQKSYTLQPPQLLPEEEKFIPSLIRGIIDGDGCISKTSYGGAQFYIVSMSKDFIDWLKYIFENRMFMIDIHIRQNEAGLYRIETANQYNILKLIALVYNKPFGMSRKYNALRETFRDYNSDPLLD